MTHIENGLGDIVMEWKDITTYSKFTKERLPRILEYRLNKDLSLIVHRHICDESTWFASVHGTKIYMVDLHTDDLETAKIKGKKILIVLLNEKIKEYELAIENLQKEIDV